MAVAVDVAVEMGPRDRRRLTKSGVALGVVAAAIAAVFLGGSPTHTGSGVSDRPHVRGFPGAWHIYSGMTKAQVLHQAGKPTAKRGSCWLYRTNFEFRGVQVDAVRACFFAGHVYERTDKLNGNWAIPGRYRLPPSVGAGSR